MSTLLLKEPAKTFALYPGIDFPSESMLPTYFPAELREASSLLRLAEGQRLFSPDAPPLACYRVVKGRVLLSRQLGYGEPLVVQHARDGDWLVEPSPYDRTVSCSAVAERASVLTVVPLRAFRMVLRGNAGFAEGWNRESARRTKRLQQTVERLGLLLASDRVHHFLATEGGARGEVCLNYPLCEWARQLGMKAETLSRVLGEMEADGSLVRIGRRGFRLPEQGTRRA